jgi:hypothetical protein
MQLSDQAKKRILEVFEGVDFGKIEFTLGTDRTKIGCKVDTVLDPIPLDGESEIPLDKKSKRVYYN